MIDTHTAKEWIIAIIAVFIASNCVLAENSTVSKLNWFQRTFKTLTWNEVSQNVETPKEICSTVRHHVKYRADNGDSWASGKEAWDRAYGDCEDIAAAVSELCAKKKIETETFMLYPENESDGHVVVVGKWKGKIWFSSNGWFEYAKSGLDVKRKIAHEMRWKKKNIIAMDWNSFRGSDTTVIPANGNARLSIPIIGQ
jgi:hypothetical protein